MVSATPRTLEDVSAAATGPGGAFATLAGTSRLRRDVVSGSVMDEARLIRFVEDPDGMVIPDLARKLPGRGLWVAADRSSVDRAARKGLFARAANRGLRTPPDLADQVEGLLLRRLLAGLGLAKKAGEITCGFEKARETILAGKAAFLIEARDGAADGRRKLLASVRRSLRPPRLVGLFGADELGLALGGENVVHSAFLAGRGAERWTIDLERLAGFRTLFPEAWELEGAAPANAGPGGGGEEP